MADFLLLFLVDRAPAQCTAAADRAVVINELLPDPPGADAGLEWVELTLTPDAPSADLTGWAILAGTSSLVPSAGNPPTALEPGEFLVVGASGLAVDLPSLGNAGSGSADAVQLVDCRGDVADTVVYGSPNPDGFLDDRGAVATSLAPRAGSGRSLARLPDGLDTDDSGEDFQAVEAPTPGGRNLPAPLPCDADGRVVINELLVDPSGDDALYEYLELHNGSDRAVDLGGWTIDAATRSDRATSTTLPSGLEIGPRGFLVVAGLARDADHHADLALGNGDGTDGVRLVDCAGSPRDTVVYGEPGNHDGITGDRGFLPEPFGAPSTDDVLARRRDGVDSDGPKDWVVRAWSSPGASNELSAAAPSEAGCQGPPEVRDAPEPVLLWLVGLVGLRRRATSRPAAAA